MSAEQPWATIVLLAPGDTEVASWPLVGEGAPDLDAVEAVARYALAAHRMGCAIRMRDSCRELAELLDLAGLVELVGSGVEVFGQSERCEQVRVEEVVLPDDPVA